MAVPGADRRKSAGGHRTGRADPTAHTRRKISGASTAFGSVRSGKNGHARAAGTETVAKPPGKHDFQALTDPAETNDGSVPEPPAIEVLGEAPVVSRRPDGAPARSHISDRVFGEDGSYLYYFTPDSNHRRTVIAG